MDELFTWKFNKSGTLPKHVLERLANSNVSAEAVGIMIFLYYHEHKMFIKKSPFLKDIFEELRNAGFMPKQEWFENENM